jgi:hypothetical protein
VFRESNEIFYQIVQGQNLYKSECNV